MEWIEISKPVLATIALIALLALESIVPMFVGRERRISHDLSNLALGLINAGVIALVFGGAVLVVTEWARENSFGLLHWIETPLWLNWIAALVLFDSWMYVWHVLNHKVALLWRFQSVHHADREVDASTALRFHTGEIVLSTMARLAVLPLIGMTVTQLLLYEAILLPVILFHHSNVRVPERLDAFLRLVIPTPWMHWVHHSRWKPETDSNYGSALSVWDRVFRTFRLREVPWELNLGLDEDREEREWRTLIGMFKRPFSRRYFSSNYEVKIPVGQDEGGTK